jgi:hypothetical protein
VHAFLVKEKGRKRVSSQTNPEDESEFEDKICRKASVGTNAAFLEKCFAVAVAA